MRKVFEDEDEKEDEARCPVPKRGAKQFAFGAGIIYSARLVLTDIYREYYR